MKSVAEYNKSQPALAEWDFNYTVKGTKKVCRVELFADHFGVIRYRFIHGYPYNDRSYRRLLVFAEDKLFEFDTVHRRRFFLAKTDDPSLQPFCDSFNREFKK